MAYNPKFREFLDSKPDVTVIGVFWAGWWRLFAIIYGVCFALLILGAALD